MVSCLPENGKVNLPLMEIFKHQANQGDITLHFYYHNPSITLIYFILIYPGGISIQHHPDFALLDNVQNISVSLVYQCMGVGLHQKS